LLEKPDRWSRPNPSARAVPARLRALWAAVGDNPVLRLSLRRGMRRGTTYALQFAYVAALMALVAILYLVVFSNPRGPGSPGEEMGKLLFLWLALLQTFFLSLTAAVLAGSSISLEREQRTLEALRLTRLSPAEVLIGKYLSLGLLLALLIGTSIPIACLGFLFGGVAPAEVVRATLLTLASTAAALAVGLACSAFCRRSSLAVAAAAGIALAGLIGIPAVTIFYESSRANGSAADGMLFFLVVVNPLFAEGHLFYNMPKVPIQAADAHLLVQASLGAIAWLAAWRRLQAESEE
jgi:ABC-type transport system involved in multi-copper enzyme maturation permease subunit